MRFLSDLYIWGICSSTTQTSCVSGTVDPQKTADAEAYSLLEHFNFWSVKWGLVTFLLMVTVCSLRWCFPLSHKPALPLLWSLRVEFIWRGVTMLFMMVLKTELARTISPRVNATFNSRGSYKIFSRDSQMAEVLIYCNITNMLEEIQQPSKYKQKTKQKHVMGSGIW